MVGLSLATFYKSYAFNRLQHLFCLMCLMFSHIFLTPIIKMHARYQYCCRLKCVIKSMVLRKLTVAHLCRLLATIGDQMMSEKQGSMNNNGFANANSWNTPGSASSTKNSGKGLLANILNVATSTRPSGSNDSLESDIPVDPFTPDLNEKLPSRVLGWGNPEVVEWLVQMNLGQYKRAFQRARVDGETLLRFVDDTALREDFGVVFRVHRNKIMYNIALLKSMK